MSSDGTPQPPGAATIPPGWYADPAGGNGKRWWDGSRWTEHVRMPEEPAPAPVVGGYAATVGTPTSVSRDFRPTTPFRQAEAGTAYTRTSWWLAGSPLWISVPEVVVFAIIDSLAPPSVPTLVIGLAIVNVLVWAALVGMAFADRAALLDGGNESAASPWWTLLSPLIYLIARALQVRLYATGGWASVIWCVVATILAPGISVLAYFAAVGLFVV
jgi:hypothetical protein